jgi:NADH dehydrogenase
MKKTILKGVKKIVIIGGGFAGLNLAKKIASDKHYEITLIDKNNYNFFPPLIYQVATGFLEPSSISYPFRKLLRRQSNLRFRLGELIKIDPIEHTCYLDNGEVYYDYLVFACGARTNYFGNENIQRNAIPMKTVNDALNMRNRLLQTLEEACRITSKKDREELLTIVIAGGGPTGVEVAGMLAELRKYILTKDYPELINEIGQIYLIHGSSHLLEQMSDGSHTDAYNALSKLGIKIKLNTLVKDFNNNQVVLSNGEIIETKSLIWAAGIIAKTFQGIPATCIGQGNRMITDAYNKVYGLDDVYAIGDTCIQKNDPAYPNGHPQLAQTALQQGANLANNFARMSMTAKLTPFIYADKGNMAVIGRNNAVCDLFKTKIHIRGFIALLIWLFVHLMSLINYRNKLRTFFNWTASYFTRDQSLRMIIRARNIENKQMLSSEIVPE